MLAMKPKTILVIDEEEAVRDSLQLVLEEEGYRCLVARDKRAAKVLLASKPIQVMVMDSQLIGSNSFFRFIKTKYPHIRMIIMSSYVEIEVTQKALMWGAHDFILKPIDFMELIDKLKFHFTAEAS